MSHHASDEPRPAQIAAGEILGHKHSEYGVATNNFKSRTNHNNIILIRVMGEVDSKENRR